MVQEKHFVFDFWPQGSYQSISFFMRVWWFEQEKQVGYKKEKRIIFLWTRLEKGERFIVQGRGTLHSDMKNERMRIPQV